MAIILGTTGLKTYDINRWKYTAAKIGNKWHGMATYHFHERCDGLTVCLQAEPADSEEEAISAATKRANESWLCFAG